MRNAHEHFQAPRQHSTAHRSTSIQKEYVSLFNLLDRLLSGHLTRFRLKRFKYSSQVDDLTLGLALKM